LDPPARRRDRRAAARLDQPEQLADDGLRPGAGDHDAAAAGGHLPERASAPGAARGAGRGLPGRGRRLRGASGVTDDKAPLLDARGATKLFGGLVAVNQIDFAIPEGAIVSLIGPNGAGKTTFFNTIAGIYAPDGGTIVFQGQRLDGQPPSEVTRRGIARTFQNIRLFNNMSALENVLVGMHVRLRAGPIGAIFRPPWVVREEREARERARALLQLVGLRRENESAKNLPYGDQRRLEIARALATQPS